MTRSLCVLAAFAILASGCASRRESDVERLRSELSELRVAQETTSRDLANATSQLQALDVKTLADEVARLNRRADAADAALADARGKLDMLATPPAVASAPPSPAASTVPAPLRPASRACLRRRPSRRRGRNPRAPGIPSRSTRRRSRRIAGASTDRP